MYSDEIKEGAVIKLLILYSRGKRILCEVVLFSVHNR